MTSSTGRAGNLFRVFYTQVLFILPMILAGVACKQANNSPANMRSTPANVAVAVKPTESETKQAPAAPAGKEIKPANGPALKSLAPPDDAIMAGKLNDLAVSLPPPDPDAAKAAEPKGTVTVEVLVNEKGEVSASSVVSGPQPLWKAAGAAARQARFAPPLKDGKPVKMAGVLIYEFK